MRAVAILEPGKVGLVHDAPKPVPGDYECLVQVKACGICSHTDLMLINGTHPVNPRFPLTYPSILGHEAVGEIVELGGKVKNLKIGDRVVSPIGKMPAPGQTRKYGNAYGGMSEYSLALDIQAALEGGYSSPMLKFMGNSAEDYITKVFPQDISFTDATMLLTFKENYSALRNFGVRPGMNVLVVGDGAVSQGVCLFLRTFDVGSVTTVGHHDDRLKRILRIAKPDRVINSHTQALEDAIGGQKFDLVIDAVGSVNVIRQCAHMLKPGGKLAVLGVLPQGNSSVNLYDMPNHISIHTMSYPYREHRTHDSIIQLIRDGVVKPSDFISHVLPVEECAEGVRLLAAREAFKVVLTF